MQCASSTTSMPILLTSVGSCCSRNAGLFSLSGETSSTSTSSASSCRTTSPHSCALVELIATARTPARAAASIWSRMSASRGDTSTVGPAPAWRSSSVATKYTADFPQPVRCTTRARRRPATRVSIASYWPSWNSALSDPTNRRMMDRADARVASVMHPASQHRPTASGTSRALLQGQHDEGTAGAGPDQADEAPDDEALPGFRRVQLGEPSDALHCHDDGEGGGESGDYRSGDSQPFKKSDRESAAQHFSRFGYDEDAPVQSVRNTPACGEAQADSCRWSTADDREGCTDKA